MPRYRDDTMSALIRIFLIVALICSAIPGAGQQGTAPKVTNPEPPKWPVEFVKDSMRLVIYQPQLRDWQKFRDLTSDTAISFTPKGGQPLLGVATWHSMTLTDTQSRIVTIKDSVLTSARFPTLDAEKCESLAKTIRETFPSMTLTISLDRMLAGFKAIQSPPAPVPISTQPPQIMVRTSPAVLLFVDGEPIRIPIEGTKLEYVVNTSWDLFYDKSDYYLLNERTWVKAKNLAGPWTVTTKLPADLSKLPAEQNWDDVRQAIPPTGKKPFEVLFTSKPAELVLFEGQPAYTKVAGTKLAYAANTENDFFIHYPDNQVYVLLSGRWFRAPNLAGSWSYAGNDLPSDFAKIPATHPRARVLVSVPGTQAARDAVLLAQVPTTVVVNRAEAEAQVKVAYSGEPKFKNIEGTPLAYAENTQEKVIKFGDLYYLCFQGVWFVSASAKGPWKTADSVPKEIYQIPPSSPVYNITYVTNTNPTPTTVESSSTSGYMGVFILGAAVGACVAYGTGYYYPPYYYWGPYPYPIYYPYPYSYGYRAYYNPATGAYGWGGAVYGPYGSAGRAAWYNPSTGRYGHAATVQTAYGGRTTAQVYNPWTGNWGSTHQGHNPYAQWGSSTFKYGDDIHHTGHIQTANNLYAGVDGNVYKRDANGNWTKWDNGGWQPVEPANKTGRKAGGDSSTYKGGQDRPSATGEGQRKVGGDDSVYKGGQDRQSATGAGQRKAGGEDSAWKPAQRADGASGTAAGQQRRMGGDDAVYRGMPDGQRPTPAADRSTPQGLGQTQRTAPASADTMHQLNRDFSARQQGAARERASGSRSMGAGGGMRMGGRRR